LIISLTFNSDEKGKGGEQQPSKGEKKGGKELTYNGPLVQEGKNRLMVALGMKEKRKKGKHKSSLLRAGGRRKSYPSRG